MMKIKVVVLLGALTALLSFVCDIKKDHGKKCDTDTVCEGICLVNMPGGLCTSYCAILPCPEETPEGRSLEAVEKVHIKKLLEEMGWNITRTAEVLGIDRVTLYNKIEKYGLRK